MQNPDAFRVLAARDSRVGEVLFLILAFEVLILAVAALVLFGERFSLRDLLGILAILTGIALVQTGGPAPAASWPVSVEPGPVGGLR